MPPLSPRMALFVDAYLADPQRDATAAARAAGYVGIGLKQQAHKLLKKPQVAAAIDARMATIHAKYQLTQERVTEELATLALSNVGDYVTDADGTVSVREGAPTRLLRALAAVKRRTTQHTTNGTTTTEHHVEIKLWDKPRALELAMKHLGNARRAMPRR